MSNSSFPLFRLPYVAFKEVFSKFGPQETFAISVCSQKSYRLIKSIKRPSQIWKIVFNRFLNDIGIDIEDDNGEPYTVFRAKVSHVSENTADNFKLETIIIGCFKVSMGAMKGIELTTYWEDEKTGMKEMAFYFTEIFNCSVHTLVIGEHKNVLDDSKWIADWINNGQKSVEELDYIARREANAEHVSYVFSNLKVNNWARAMVNFTHQLSRPEIRIAPLSLKYVEIAGAYWMTLEHILSFDCEETCFHTTNLTSHDLNALLKQWMNGAVSRLQLFRIDTNDSINYETILRGVEFEKVPQNIVRQYYDDECIRKIKGGYDIRRKSDGLTVTLVDSAASGWFELVITSKLQYL